MSYRARPLTEAPVEPFTWDTIDESTSPAGRPAKTSAAAQRDAADEEMRLATLERDAFAKGYAQGERAGTEAGAARTEGMLKRLGQTIEELAALRSTIVRRTERQTVQLVLAIAERVVQREIALDRSLLVGMARAALDRLGEYGSATIRLHPDDFRVIVNTAVAAEGAPVRIQADAVVSRGGCLVQSDFGFMDVSPEAQFRELARTLLAGEEAAPEVAVVSGFSRTNANPLEISLEPYLHEVRDAQLTPLMGRVTRVVGLLIESDGPHARVGEVCEIISTPGEPPLAVEVVGFQDGRLLSVPLGDTSGIRPGARVVARGRFASVPVGDQLLGRVVDAFGVPIDGKGSIRTPARAPLYRTPVHPLTRRPIAEPIATGVRAIDTLLTCGRGQRVGLFGGSGVGKSTLLGMMARGTAADVVVLALVGERGREVRGFLDNDIGPEGLSRSVIVVSTSDNPPLVRMRAAYAATTIAEHFRDQGLNVLLMMDSITRFAMAQREVGLAAGEPPTAKGYPPSVFALLPGLLERAGNGDRGSITALYTVLVEGDDTNEPIADAVRAILDGHIVLSRELAGRNHYPAIDVLQSVSRTIADVTEREHRARVAQVRDWLATIRDSEDLLSVGAYVKGANARLDTALERRTALDAFLRQAADMPCRAADGLEALRQVTAGAAA